MTTLFEKWCVLHNVATSDTTAAMQTLEEFRSELLHFDGCALKKQAKSTVIGQGNQSGPVMVMGEAPGATEDELGVPFCGESGALLDKVLASIGIDRNINAYITNVVFWRPPGNRAPSIEEIEICRPFFERHVALVNPRLLVLCGSVAFQALFNKVESVSSARGKILQYANEYLAVRFGAHHFVPTVVTYHPSYLLRQPYQKKAAWQDMMFIARNFAELLA